MSVLTASGAGVRHHRRWLVRDLDLRVDAGETVAVIGPPGSGRTSTLLALARRLRLTTGKIEIGGTAALAHVPGVEEPEPVFTVRDHVRERLALLGHPRRAAATVPLYGLDPELRGRDLSPYQRHLLGLALAMLTDPAVIALDGVDAGLDHAEQNALWRLLAEIATGGAAVLVTAREIDAALVNHVVLLDDPRTGTPGRPLVTSTPGTFAEVEGGEQGGGSPVPRRELEEGPPERPEDERRPSAGTTSEDVEEEV
ncbi:ATP-binding cassette domain-containing protein [Actinoplanes hulinensis]|uniref:ATP-binding cassette domain-containing protein n=1 Tax=Actinoplanes hulinensis TaxID=1144547 RepID=A0ABS7BAY1_9ACTN|nr:ATP-binding cassette domain-containing protein [Actinoplanes hulinensis]MBW6438226.1 ATP-binding cassette domain-containing protein [Actinoplanes hulinensis]